MKLHLDRAAFLVLIDSIHKRTGYREDVLEKDYYVTLILKELADKQTNGLPAYFKGGTALYKALKTTNRFSNYLLLKHILGNPMKRTGLLRQQNISMTFPSCLTFPEFSSF